MGVLLYGMATPEEKKARKRARRLRWRELHPEQWREEKRRYQRRYYARKQAALGKTTTTYRLKIPDPGTINFSRGSGPSKYGISQEDFDALFKQQEGRCAICDTQLKRPWTEGHRHKAHIDHCHRSGAVRGILCTNCNTGIGLFHDDVWKLKRAVQYLEKHFCPT